ncbi:MAG: hypothetical protein KGJ32_08615 [Xanthomonadaceae bacterium]|nr:hypothetical protein [Xanthomonadaceae bacterium]
MFASPAAFKHRRARHRKCKERSPTTPLADIVWRGMGLHVLKRRRKPVAQRQGGFLAPFAGPADEGLQVEEVHGRKRRNDRQCLKSQDRQRKTRSPRQPLDREKCHERHLPGDEKLKDVRGSAFVGLMGSASQGESAEHQGQRRG